MKGLFPDWRAQGVTVCLHEHQGGFAFNMDSVHGLYAEVPLGGRGRALGSRGHGLRGGAPTAPSRGVETSEGAIEVGEQVVIAPGPWAKRFWAMLGHAGHDRRPHAVRRGRPRPAHVDVLEPPGRRDRGRPAAVRDRGRIGTAGDPPRHGRAARTPTTGSSSRTSSGGSTSSATATASREAPRRSSWTGDVELDPYPQTTNVDPTFPDMWCAALSHSMARFEGCRPQLQGRALGRRRRVHGRQLPGLRLLPAEPVRDPRLEPRLQDDRGRDARWPPCSSASTRASSTRSASSASRRATSTPSRARRTPGPEHGRAPSSRSREDALERRRILGLRIDVHAVTGLEDDAAIDRLRPAVANEYADPRALPER